MTEETLSETLSRGEGFGWLGLPNPESLPHLTMSLVRLLTNQKASSQKSSVHALLETRERWFVTLTTGQKGFIPFHPSIFLLRILGSAN